MVILIAPRAKPFDMEGLRRKLFNEHPTMFGIPIARKRCHVCLKCSLYVYVNIVIIAVIADSLIDSAWLDVLLVTGHHADDAVTKYIGVI